MSDLFAGLLTPEEAAAIEAAAVADMAKAGAAAAAAPEPNKFGEVWVDTAIGKVNAAVPYNAAQVKQMGFKIGDCAAAPYSGYEDTPAGFLYWIPGSPKQVQYKKDVQALIGAIEQEKKKHPVITTGQYFKGIDPAAKEDSASLIQIFGDPKPATNPPAKSLTPEAPGYAALEKQLHPAFKRCFVHYGYTHSSEGALPGYTPFKGSMGGKDGPVFVGLKPVSAADGDYYPVYQYPQMHKFSTPEGALDCANALVEKSLDKEAKKEWAQIATATWPGDETALHPELKPLNGAGYNPAPDYTHRATFKMASVYLNLKPLDHMYVDNDGADVPHPHNGEYEVFCYADFSAPVNTGTKWFKAPGDAILYANSLCEKLSGAASTKGKHTLIEKQAFNSPPVPIPPGKGDSALYHDWKEGRYIPVGTAVGEALGKQMAQAGILVKTSPYLPSGMVFIAAPVNGDAAYKPAKVAAIDHNIEIPAGAPKMPKGAPILHPAFKDITNFYPFLHLTHEARYKGHTLCLNLHPQAPKMGGGHKHPHAGEFLLIHYENSVGQSFWHTTQAQAIVAANVLYTRLKYEASFGSGDMEAMKDHVAAVYEADRLNAIVSLVDTLSAIAGKKQAKEEADKGPVIGFSIATGDAVYAGDVLTPMSIPEVFTAAGPSPRMEAAKALIATLEAIVEQKKVGSDDPTAGLLTWPEIYKQYPHSKVWHWSPALWHPNPAAFGTEEWWYRPATPAESAKGESEWKAAGGGAGYVASPPPPPATDTPAGAPASHAEASYVPDVDEDAIADFLNSIDASPPKPVFAVDTEEKAEWFLRKLANIDAERARIKANAAAMLKALDTQEAKHNERYRAQFLGFSKANLPKKGKTKKYLQGFVTFRNVPGGLVVSDPAAALKFIEEEDPEQYGQCVIVQKKLDTGLWKMIATEHLGALGELMPGCTRVDAHESASIKFIAPSQPLGGGSAAETEQEEESDPDSDEL